LEAASLASRKALEAALSEARWVAQAEQQAAVAAAKEHAAALKEQVR
jgi:hypothetical protein